MDINPSLPLLATSQGIPSPTGNMSSPSSSFSIRAPPSVDTDTEKTVKLNSNSNSNIIMSSSGSYSSSYDSSSENGGFLSGEEGFETASERQFVAEVDVDADDDEFVGLPIEVDEDEEDVVVPFVEMEGFESLRPKARISGDDDDDDNDSEVFADVEEEENGFLSEARVGEYSGAVEEIHGVEVLEDRLGSEDELESEIKIVDGSKVEDHSGSEVKVLDDSIGEEEEKVEFGVDIVDDKVVEEDSLSKDLSSVINFEKEILEEKVVSLDKSPIFESNLVEYVDNVDSEVHEVFPVRELQNQEEVEEEKKVEVFDVDDFSARSEYFVDAKETSNMEDNKNFENDAVEFQVNYNDVVNKEVIDYISPGIRSILKSNSEEDSLVEGHKEVLNELKVTFDLPREKKEVVELNIMEIPAESHVNSGSESDVASVFVEENTGLKLAKADTDLVQVDEAYDIKSRVQELKPVEKTVEVEVQKNNCIIDRASVNDNASLPSKDESESSDLNSEAFCETITHEVTLQVAANKVEPTFSDAADFFDSAQAKNLKLVGLSSMDDSLQTTVEHGHGSVTNGSGEVEEVVSPKAPTTCVKLLTVDSEDKQEGGDAINNDPDDGEKNIGSVSDGAGEGLIFNGSVTAEQIMKELERISGINSRSGATSSEDHLQEIDGKIVTDSDEEVDTDEEEDSKELFDSAALTALLKAATGGKSDGSKMFSIERPAGMGSSIPSVRPALQSNKQNLFSTSDAIDGKESENNLDKETKEMLEKVQLLRVKFLRLLQRLGQPTDDPIAAQVLYRLLLASGRFTSQNFSLEAAKKTAKRFEADEKHELNFSLNILVLGKSGVGKSATINSIFGEEKAVIDAFQPATTVVKEINGSVNGVKIRVFDTPGLSSSVMDRAFNQKVLSSIKKVTKKCPPDIVLYVDRLDTQLRDLNDLPLLRSITSSLGPAIWRNSIVTLTHAASAPPEGQSGSPLSYDVYVAQRSHIVQQAIGQSVGDLRLMNPNAMNPSCLVENHPSCRRNREGHRVLPNGQSWRQQLLLLAYSIKILSEASALAKPQDSLDTRKLFGFRMRSPPLPYLLTSLLQSRPHPKLSNSEGDNVDSDIDLEDFSDSDREEEEEYDQLPPFKPLKKSQVAKLSKEQRKAYFEEYEYRVKLLQKKQWKEELKRLKEIKKKGKDRVDTGFAGEDNDQENGNPDALKVPLPDLVLPNSFDGDNPTHRYRFLEPTSHLLARPVLDSHGWDHDCGYDGVNLESNLGIAGRFPTGVVVQITKDKKEFNVRLDSSIAAKYGESGSTLAGFDVQNVGKQLAYIVRGETKFKIFERNKTTAGASVTFLGENVITGLKVEDQIAIGKRLVFVGSSGATRCQSDTAYGANLEVRLKDKDFPIGQDQSTLGLSLMKYRGDLALMGNLQSQISIGGGNKVAVRVGMNNKNSGQITISTSSSEQLQIALVGILPIVISIFRTIWPGSSERYPY